MPVFVTVSESMTVTEFVTLSVISCPFPLSFQTRPVPVAGAVTMNLNVSQSAWPRVRSPWLCPCITTPVSVRAVPDIRPVGIRYSANLRSGSESPLGEKF